MNRKPDRALATLQKTRAADLSNDLRDQRLLIEARAMSNLGRHELALELITNINSREAMRLRSDILWAARRWRDAGEQIELLYGNRWREFAPLNDTERSDILRAAICYALSEEAIGVARLREKYEAKFSDGADRGKRDRIPGYCQEGCERRYARCIPSRPKCALSGGPCGTAGRSGG
jgi:hypothetical protein